MMEITRALRYSYRPWPKGCSKSGFRSASLAPATVITEDSTSDRLFSASIRMAMELVLKPTTALNPASRRLTRIPMQLVRRMIFSRRPFVNEIPISTSQPLSYRIAPIIAQMEWLENGHPGVFLPMNRKKSERPSRAFQKLDVRLLAISRTDLLLNRTKLTSDF